MDNKLNDKLKITIDEFDKFLQQSNHDLQDEEEELAQLTQTLLKEQAIARSLELEKASNQAELDRLGKSYQTQKVLLDNLLNSYKSK